MNNHINEKLEVCHMTLERALQCVNHMRNITQFPADKSYRENAPLLDYFHDSLILGHSKINTAHIQFKDLKTGFDKMVKQNASKK